MMEQSVLDRKVFLDGPLNELLRQQGYVVLTNFLDPLECRTLSDFYQNNPSELKEGFHSSIHSNDRNYRRSVSEEIGRLFDPKAQQLLVNYRSVFSSFTVKEPDARSGFDLHLDWSMVDEMEHTSLTVWVPLIDITDNNGLLWVLQGSHEFHHTIRGGKGLRLWCSVPPTVWDRKYELRALKLAMGDAVVYDHRLFHGSPPNLSGKRRLAINHTLIPVEAQSLHYQFHGHDRVEILEVPDDFYHSHILNTTPREVISLSKSRIGGAFVFQDGVNRLIA